MAVIVSAFLLSAIPASAHQNPANCTGNNLGLDLLKNKTQIVNGETVQYTVNVRNDAAGACDITNATVSFTCPGPDGQPTGATTVCATGASYLAGFPPTQTCLVDCVVAVNPGVGSAQAKSEVHGTLHDNPANDFDTADVLKFISVQILFCGDGVINVPGETCEPPNTPAGPNGNTCRDNCTVCGDAHLDAGEQCDDGNNNNNDGCRNSCLIPICGDGIVDAGEQCDDGNTNNTDACRNNCTIPVCGDGILDAGEACDDGNTNNADSCRNNCTIPVCGDGIVDAGEQCDDGNTNNNDACRNNCTLPICGDGIVDAGEACDDGNTNNADSCRNDCTIPRCGDGIVDAGEACDDGNTNNTDACRNDCTIPLCGDGIVDAGEACDDGNTNNTDACRNNCTIPRCGDGIVDAGEACDDGNTNNNDTCRNNCTIPVCGDGIVDAGEACDDGNTNNTDACRNNCTIPRCGDGIVDAGEACDDGNTNNGDSCRNNCTIPVCGDGIVDAGEACDDGNTNNTDACRNDCTLPFCGDGIVDAGEECDDGNDVAGDGCENDCTPTLIEAICRTPGFWGTHAGTEKSRSQNITEAVIDCADGNCADHTANDYLLICGEKIDSPDSHPADGTTDWNDASSSTEALCVRVQGASITQLARQLTAGALNCIMSNGDETCASTPLYATVFASCNATCTDPAATKAQLTACIGELDCLNNGGTFNGGICSPGGPNNCHERLLNNDDLGLHFDPPGPAGSSDACNAATDSKCTVVGSGEGMCGTDTLP